MCTHRQWTITFGNSFMCNHAVVVFARNTIYTIWVYAVTFILLNLPRTNYSSAFLRDFNDFIAFTSFGILDWFPAAVTNRALCVRFCIIYLFSETYQNHKKFINQFGQLEEEYVESKKEREKMFFYSIWLTLVADTKFNSANGPMVILAPFWMRFKTVCNTFCWSDGSKYHGTVHKPRASRSFCHLKLRREHGEFFVDYNIDWLRNLPQFWHCCPCSREWSVECTHTMQHRNRMTNLPVGNSKIQIEWECWPQWMVGATLHHHLAENRYRNGECDEERLGQKFPIIETRQSHDISVEEVPINVIN